MRTGWGRVIPLCAIAIAACAPLGTSPVYNESLMTAFDPKEWTVGHQSEDQRQSVIEFVPPGQKITA
jgi:hypothetical protein